MSIKKSTGSSGNKEQIRRWIILDQLLRTPLGYNIITLNEKLNEILERESVTKRNGDIKLSKERNLRNDIANMEDLFGCKISIIRNRGKFRYEEMSMSIFNSGITKEEFNSLSFLLKQAKKSIPKKKQEELSALLQKLYNPLNIKMPQVSEQRAFVQTTLYSEMDAQWLNVLFDYISNRDCIEIIYTNKTKISKTYQLCPLGIKEYNGLWYLVAYDFNNTERRIKIFRISRIALMHMIKKEIPEHLNQFSMEEYFYFSTGIHHELEQKPERVTIEVTDGKWADELIQRKINDTQMHEVKKDKTIFHLRAFISYELVNIILMMDHHVKVIAPESLKEKIKEKLEGHLKNYAP
jgi:predicted DNA-binding transcriptional regulator YafY